MDTIRCDRAGKTDTAGLCTLYRRQRRRSTGSRRSITCLLSKQPGGVALRQRTETVGVPAVADLVVVPPERRDRLRQTLEAARARGRQLEEDLRKSHCPKAAGYVHRLLEQALAHVEVWLELGITLPRTTSFLEGLMGRLGRRRKKIAWNWPDAGATRRARVLLKKILEPEEWQAWVRKHLTCEGKCFAVITSIRTTQVTGFV
ncbi:MAG: hypothetical protein ACOC8E_00040 [Planctomycetota bacterium]